MKYVQAQNGQVMSISQLIPPHKGTIYDYDPSVGHGVDKEYWRLNLITLNGKREMYASYHDQMTAMAVYAYMVIFIRSEGHIIEFEHGADGLPAVKYAVDLVAFRSFLESRKTMSEEEEDDSSGDADQSG